MPNSKVIGGILLIVGTSIGAGMLALPISTAAAGMTNSIVFLVLCWLIMSVGALLILEVNLRLPAGSNMVSMAKSTLGLPGQIISWVSYLLLLYALLAGYISGGTDVFNGLLVAAHIHVPTPVISLVFTVLFSFIIYGGIRIVDYINRGLMFGKLGIYLILVVIIAPHIDLPKLNGGSLQTITSCIMILITSFSFATIVPSLREYFEDDIPSLRRVIVIGSFIPLLCYIIWNAVIMGVVDRDGTKGLLALMNSNYPTSGLTEAISLAVQSKWITGFFSFFTSICMLTAFLGVSLGLFDFLADGLKLKKQGSQGRFTLALTFLPPLVIVLINPAIYLRALNYAGVFCVILLLLLPALMAWKGRKQALPHDKILVKGGNIGLIIVILISIFLLYLAI